MNKENKKKNHLHKDLQNKIKQKNKIINGKKIVKK